MKHLLRIVSLSALVMSLAIVGFIYEESSVAEAISLSPQTDAVVVTLNVIAEITISNSPDISLSNSIGVTNTTAVGTSSWTVVTNNSTGYFLAVKAGSNPAMQQSSTLVVDDYSTTSMPSTWSVAATTAKFGFSAFGTDTVTGTWGTGSFCNGAATSTVSTTLKYYGFYTAAPGTTTASRTSTTTPSGVTTTLCYAAQEGTSYFIPSGVYTATITATATVN